MEIPATPENRVLANAVNARLKSDARILNAKAAFWRLAGVALVCAMIGVGIGAALYGWTYSRAPVIQAEQVAEAVARALAATTLKSEGTVKLDPDSVLALAQPKAPEMPRPTETQLGSGSAPASRAAVATAFTVFKNVPMGSGQVVTGWNFTSSEQKAPQHQYCYYSEQIDGTSKVTIDLGENGRPVPPAKTRASMDPVLAYANCVWFKGGAI